MSCQPELERLGSPAALPDLLGAALGVPVGLLSAGPTAADKRLVTGLRRVV